MAINKHRRLRSENYDLDVRGYHLTATLAYDEADKLRELAFVGRGKVGTGLDPILAELGIQLSRALQSRMPETGELLPD